MTTHDAARSRPRAFWGDARFFLGILLIAVSIAGVWFVVTASRQTVPIFAATRTIVPGEAVTTADLRVVDVALGQAEQAYLTAVQAAEGLVANRTIAAGELVPASALDATAATRTTTIVIRSAIDVPASLAAGSIVEVWSAPPAEDTRGFGVPAILVPDATVVSVTRDESMIGGDAATLELVIPRSDVAATLAAIASDAALSVVPTAASAP